jgi:hypothetical protein
MSVCVGTSGGLISLGTWSGLHESVGYYAAVPLFECSRKLIYYTTLFS